MAQEMRLRAKAVTWLRTKLVLTSNPNACAMSQQIEFVQMEWSWDCYPLH